MSVLDVFLIVFFVLLLLGMPIAFSLGIASTAFLVFRTDLPGLYVVQKMFSGVDSFPLLAVPFFILAGNLMNGGGVTKRLLDFCNIFVGRFRGGLAAVSIVGSMIFAGISGSAAADASGLGSILIPTMNDQGYDKEYSSAINATSSTIAMLIPPSIPMVLLATIASASVRDLFFSSAVAGVLAGVSMLIVNGYLSLKRNYPSNGKVKMKDIPRLCIKCLPSVIMPALILCAIVFGWMTATEASCLAVIYALFTGIFIYKQLTPKSIFQAFIDAAIQTAVVMLIVATASLLSSLMSYLLLPQIIADWALVNLHSQWAILAVVAVTALVCGCFMDVSPALILLGAIFSPVIKTMGVSVLQFAAVLCMSLSIGLYTPPVGLTLIISSKIAGSKITSDFKYCLPFMIPELILIVLLIFIPGLSVGLPTLMFG
ncbi:MAG: TRAP transporter large permease [Lachnospiraceae bacterium]|nr:TRAP transporter large permease [Lachnospiraceae bacterium]